MDKELNLLIENASRASDNGYSKLNECVTNEDREAAIKELKTLNDILESALRLKYDSDEMERRYAYDVDKSNAEIQNQINTLRKEIAVESVTLLVSTGLSIAGMAFYKNRFREGLLFEVDGTIASGFVKSLTNKMPDWYKKSKSV